MPPRSLARQIQSFTLVTILGASATGCTLIDEFFDESVSLKEFAPAEAQVSAELTDMSRSQLVLEPKGSACPTMKDDITADVDSKPMDVFIKGGKQPSGKSWICGAPTFRRNTAAADFGGASTSFVVDDDTAKITVVATGLLLEREVTPTVPNVPLVAGVESSFDWSVVTDAIDAKQSSADFIYDDPSLVLTAEVGIRVEGSLVFIRLPTDAPAGTGSLHLDVLADVPIEKCEGVPACSGSVHVVKDLAMDAAAVKP